MHVIWDTAVFIALTVQGSMILWLRRRVAWLESSPPRRSIVIDQDSDDR
jgi:hypothetical protein